MNKYKRLGKNSLLVFIGSISSKLLAVIMLPFYTAWLSVKSFGDVDLVMTYVSLLMSFITLSITDAIFRFPQGKTKSEQSYYFCSGIALVLCSIFIFGLVYKLILHSNIDLGVFSSYAGYIYCILFFSFLQLYTQQFSRSVDRMSVYVSSGIILTFTTALSSLLLVPKYGLHGYLLSQLLGLIVSITYTFISLKLNSFLSLKFVNLKTIKEMITYTIPLIPNATLWWILGTSNRLFLEHYCDVSSVGIFAVSNKFPTIITMIFNTFFLSWQISVLEEYNKDGFTQFYNKIIRICVSVLILAGIILSITSYWIVFYFADSDYIEAWRYIPYLSIASIFSSLSVLFGTMFMVEKKTKYFLITSIWGSISCILLNFILIPRFGIMGATISLLLSHLLIFILRIIKSEKYVNLESKLYYVIQIILLFTNASICIYIENPIIKLILNLIILICLILPNIRYIQSIDFKQIYYTRKIK